MNIPSDCVSLSTKDRSIADDNGLNEEAVLLCGKRNPLQPTIRRRTSRSDTMEKVEFCGSRGYYSQRFSFHVLYF
jgi:hypothetical protein